MHVGPRSAALAAASGAVGVGVLAVVATAGIASAGGAGEGPRTASRPAALPTCPPSSAPASSPTADEPVSYNSGSFAPATARPSYGAGLSIANHQDRALTVSRTDAPTFVLTIPPGSVRHLTLPSSAPTALRYAGDVPAGLTAPSEHAVAVVVMPASPAPPSTVQACVVATGSPSASRSPSRSPSKSASKSPSRSPSRPAAGSPSPSGHASATGRKHPSASASRSTQVVVIPPGDLPSEQPSLAPIQSGVKPSVAPVPSIVLPTFTEPATPNAAPTSVASPPVVNLAQPVPARHRGLPITIGIALICGVGSAVARAVRGLRS